MTNSPKITIAKGLDISEISIRDGFSHARVIDLRCDGEKARPIEEAVLKRLNNHFVDYFQIPIDFETAGPCQEIHLGEVLREHDTDVLVITDDLAKLATILGIYQIEFTTNSFYIVETGMGEVIRPMPTEENVPEIAVEEYAPAKVIKASFGSF